MGQASAVVIFCGFSFLGLVLYCLSTQPGFGFKPYFEKVFIQEREERGSSMFLSSYYRYRGSYYYPQFTEKETELGNLPLVT